MVVTKAQVVVFQQVTAQVVQVDQAAVEAQAQEETLRAVLTKARQADTQATAMVAVTDNLVGPAVAVVVPVVEAKVHQEITMVEMAEQAVKVLSQDHLFTILEAAVEPDKTVQTVRVDQVVVLLVV